MKMIKQFKQYITKNKLITPNDKILLTISGGADSIAMLNLFLQTKYKIAVAHCNFMLRGQNSNEDQTFVQEICSKTNTKFHTKKCNAKKYATENKISIEMAAREIRYKWFKELSEKYKYTKIATAHHKNDSAETIILNLTHKTGIKGLTGIPLKNNKIIRPILFATKNQIEKYCKKNNIKYRTDTTNFNSKFQRNKIRNQIIPKLIEINPATIENIIQSAKNLNQYQQLFEHNFEKFKQKCTKNKTFTTEIDKNKIQNFIPTELFLFKFIQKYGFNASQTQNIIQTIKNSGKQFFSEKYKLIIDREKIIISKKQTPQKQTLYYIHKNDKNIQINENQPDEISISIHENTIQKTKITKNKNIAYIDQNKITFPLKIRKWKNADHFFPIGLKYKKKLSNFFTDNKINIIEKENIWLLCNNNNEIIWIIGHRPDNRYKITKETKNTIIIKLQENKNT